MFYLCCCYQVWQRYQTRSRQQTVGCFESMNVARVLDKGVDYIREVCRINPLRYSYTTIKRFTARLQMFPPSSFLRHVSDPVP